MLAERARARPAAASARRGRCRRGRATRRSARARAAGRRRAATGMSVRPARSSTRSAFAVVFSSVWFPWTVVTPSTSSSGLASASSSAIASSCPGSQSRMIGVRHRADYRRAIGAEERVDLGRRRQRRLGAEPRGGERAGRARARECLLLVAPLEQRDEQARGERVARCSAVDDLDARRRRPRDLLPVLEQHRALGAERERDEAVACGASDSSSKRLTTARSGSTAIRRAGAALRQNMPVACSQAASTACVRDLLLAEDGVGSGSSKPPTRSFAPGETTIVVSPVASTVIRATPVGSALSARSSSTPPVARPASASSANGVSSDRADDVTPRRAVRTRRPGSLPCRRGTARASRRSPSRRAAAASAQRTTRSRLTEPTTVIRGARSTCPCEPLDGKRRLTPSLSSRRRRTRLEGRHAASARRSSTVDAEQRVAQVEQARPERRAVGRAVEPRRVGEPLAAPARAPRARDRRRQLGSGTHARRRDRAPGATRRARPRRARRTTSGPRRAPARARAGSARAAPPGRRAPSRRGRRRAGAPPRALRRSRHRPRRGSSARAAGRRRAPPPRRRAAAPSAAAP